MKRTLPSRLGCKRQPLLLAEEGERTCLCGCGYRAGDRAKFVQGHHNRIQSQQTIERIAKAKKTWWRRRYSDKGIAAMILELRTRWSSSHRGKTKLNDAGRLSQSLRMRNNLHLLGHKHNRATRLKMSQAHRGYRHSIETRKKLGVSGEDNPAKRLDVRLRNSRAKKLWWKGLPESEKAIIIARWRVRKQPSNGELSMARLLQDNDILAEAEHPFGRHTVDFYVPASHLAIEVDGEYWHSPPAARRKDRRRDNALRRLYGLRIARFPASVLKRSPERVSRRLRKMTCVAV